MSWFSNSKRDDLSNNAKLTKGEAKAPGVVWVETSSEEVFQKTLDNMFAETVATIVPALDKDLEVHNLKASLGSLVRKIKKIDRNRLTADNRKRLAIIVFDSVPRAISDLETSLMDVEEQDWAVEEFTDGLMTIIRTQIDSMPCKIPVPNQLSTISEQTVQKAIETVGSKESDAKLARVTALAKQAYVSATSVEDRFFAEQTANSYLPDSVRMLAGLINAPDDMKKEANELFMRQLEILETQLNGVLGRTAMTSLSAMKAHTEFLENKNDRLVLNENNPLG